MNSIRRAFTLVELIVVIVIATILMLIAVPSFSAMLRTSEASLAENLLRTAMRGARDLALQNEGRDAAAVFFFEPGGRLTVVPCAVAGELDDAPNGNTPTYAYREVFAPVPGYAPVQLPKGWMIRGFAPPEAVDTGDWYANSGARYDPDEGNWVFPETGFYDYEDAEDDGKRQTFLVRFKGGTGAMATGLSEPVLVVSPRPSGTGRAQAPFDSARIDQAEDLSAFVTRVLRNPALTLEDKRKLLGNRSADTALARPLSLIGLYDEGALARDLGVRVDPESGSLYRPPLHLVPGNPGRGADEAELVTGIDEPLLDFNRWMIGDTDLNDEVQVAGGGDDGTDEPQAKIFSIDRYTGGLREVEVQP